MRTALWCLSPRSPRIRWRITGQRKEFQEALETGEGSDSRSSATFSESTYYYALRLDNGMVIRVSNTADSVWATVFFRAGNRRGSHRGSGDCLPDFRGKDDEPHC